jgi:hypothetical protein
MYPTLATALTEPFFLSTGEGTERDKGGTDLRRPQQ